MGNTKSALPVFEEPPPPEVPTEYYDDSESAIDETGHFVISTLALSFIIFLISATTLLTIWLFQELNVFDGHFRASFRAFYTAVAPIADDDDDDDIELQITSTTNHTQPSTRRLSAPTSITRKLHHPTVDPRTAKGMVV
jgi:hypothetical protein